MTGKVMLSNCLSVPIISIFIVLFSTLLFSEDKNHSVGCVDQAIKKIIEIRSLPEIEYLRTLDGQYVLLDEFYDKSLYLFPQCSLFEKFYYWLSKIIEVESNSENGIIKHKIRCYYNCLTTFCPKSCDPRKTHGDVAEFYDHKGNFMGIAVYMGDGKYCSLPFSGYKR